MYLTMQKFVLCFVKCCYLFHVLIVLHFFISVKTKTDAIETKFKKAIKEIQRNTNEIIEKVMNKACFHNALTHISIYHMSYILFLYHP